MEHTLRGQHLDGCGNVDLLSSPLTAFFASRVCPAPAIRAGLAWALVQAEAGVAVIGGFHSPLARSVLNLLLEARSPVIAVLAREIASARLPIDWRIAIHQGHMAVVSQAVGRRRLDHDRSISRNELVVRLAYRIVVAHVSESGSLAVQMREWRRRGKCVRLLGEELVGPEAPRHGALAK